MTEGGLMVKVLGSRSQGRGFEPIASQLIFQRLALARRSDNFGAQLLLGMREKLTKDGSRDSYD
jgi:hypothetical protein